MIAGVYSSLLFGTLYSPPPPGDCNKTHHLCFPISLPLCPPFHCKANKKPNQIQTLLGVTFCKSLAPAKLENCRTDGRNFTKVSPLSSQVNDSTGCDCLCDFFRPAVPQVRNLFPAQDFNSFLHSFTLLPAAPLLPPPLSTGTPASPCWRAGHTQPLTCKLESWVKAFSHPG